MNKLELEVRIKVLEGKRDFYNDLINTYEERIKEFAVKVNETNDEILKLSNEYEISNEQTLTN